MVATVNFATFQTGDLSEFDSTLTSGSPTVQSSVARLGTYALQINPTAAAQAVGIRGLAASGAFANNTAVTSLFRFFFRMDALPSGNVKILSFTPASGTLGSLTVTSAGKLRLQGSGGATISTGSSTLTPGIWYGIQLGFAGATGAFVGGLSSAGNAFSLELIGTNAGFVGTMAQAFLGTVDSATISCYFADFLWLGTTGTVPFTQLPGHGQGVVMTPNADGNYTNGTANGAANKFSCLSQIPSDGDTTYVDGLLLNQAYTATVTTAESALASNSSVGAINTVKGLVIARNLGAGGTAGVRVRSGSTDSDSTGVAGSAAYAPVAKLFDTDPNTSAAWTATNLDAAEVGFVEDVIGNRFTAAFLLADLTAVAIPPVQPKRRPEWLELLDYIEEL